MKTLFLILLCASAHAAPIPRFAAKTADVPWYSARLKAFALNDQVWLARAYEGTAKGTAGRVTVIDAEWELIVVVFDNGRTAKFDMVVQASKLLLSAAPK